jgi:hypothetical protein
MPACPHCFTETKGRPTTRREENCRATRRCAPSTAGLLALLARPRPARSAHRPPSPLHRFRAARFVAALSR